MRRPGQRAPSYANSKQLSGSSEKIDPAIEVIESTRWSGRVASDGRVFRGAFPSRVDGRAPSAGATERDDFRLCPRDRESRDRRACASYSGGARLPLLGDPLL